MQSYSQNMGKISKKLRRQHALRQLIKENKLSTQDELKDELQKMGIDVTQSSLSRDLNELGVMKKQGYYHLLSEGQSRGVLPPITSLRWAGPNLIVLKTYPSMAPSMGSLIDEQNIPGIVGTVAGDDTLFVATGPQVSREEIEKRLRKFFG